LKSGLVWFRVYLCGFFLLGAVGVGLPWRGREALSSQVYGCGLGAGPIATAVSSAPAATVVVPPPHHSPVL